MPAIFIVSGYSYYLYANSRPDRNIATMSAKTYFYFLASRFTRILVPYAIYVMTCIALIYILSLLGTVNNYNLGSLIIAWINPFNPGRNFSVGMLNWHLWFVPVFLIVTAILPIATQFRPFKNPHILPLVIGVAITEVLITQVHFPGEDITKQVIFYLAFALFGYYIAHSGENFRSYNFGRITIISAVLLGLIVVKEGDFSAMNMQTNKFPPNYIFFLFSCLWVSLFLVISNRAPEAINKLESYGDRRWLRPFVTSGYSIYLWQGIGYTAAFKAGKMIDLPVLAVWLLALGLSVGLGLLAAPLERIRFRL
jgi:peptidoglycan/LPS O-acetylase OafA/YrhL